VLVLLVFATHLHWRQDTIKNLWLRTNKFILGFSVLALAALYLLRSFPVFAILGIVLGAWVVLGTLYKLIVGIKQLSWARFGMIFGHLGLGIAVLGMALTSTLSIEKEFSLAQGQTVSVGAYHFTFEDLKDTEGPNFQGIMGQFVIKQGDKVLTDLYPEKRYFVPRNLPMTETAIAPGLLKDFYIALGERLEDGSWTIRIYIKPFVRWIWLGGLIIALGALCSSLVAFRKVNSHD
jgi:cytochrome c-type biogenesis protein CcmF